MTLSISHLKECSHNDIKELTESFFFSQGFREDYPFPHAHTLFLMEMGNAPKLYPEQLRAKMLMFAFGNALARAQALYGVRPLCLKKSLCLMITFTLLVKHLGTL